MKVLVLAPQPFFSPRGTPFSVYYRTKTMVDLGEDVHLLTYGQGQDVELGAAKLFRTPPLRVLGGIPTGPSWRKLLHDAILFVYAIILLTRYRYDYVHAHEEAVFIAVALKPFFRFKLLYDMHSSLPEQLANFSYTRSRTVRGLFRWAERLAVQKSEAVIVVCPALLNHARSLVSDERKIVLIENSLFDPVVFSGDSSLEEPNEAIANAAALAAEGHPLILYTGTLEAYQGIPLLLEGFARLLSHQPRAHLLLVGGSPSQVRSCQSLADDLGAADRCLLAGTVSPTMALSCNEFATVVVSPRLTGTNTPMKIYAQLASGVPILATRVESHTQILTHDVAILVEPDPDGLAQGLRLALEAPEEALRRAANAKALYEQEYSRASYVRRTEKVLDLLR